jgi:phage minor structural protein
MGRVAGEVQIVKPTIYIFAEESCKLMLNNHLPDGCPILSCILHEQVNGECSLRFSVSTDHPDCQQIDPGDWAIIQDWDGHYRAFVIIAAHERGSDQAARRAFYTEELAITELNDEVVADVRPQHTNARNALNHILARTRWQAGRVDDLGIASVTVSYESALTGIQKVVEAWGGEICFRITMGPDHQITGRYIDLLSRLGKKTGKRYEIGKDILSYHHLGEVKWLKTALYGRGKGEETDRGGDGRRVTFKEVEWKQANGDPVDKPKGQEWVGDTDALAEWGHFHADGTRRHRFGVHVNEKETDPVKLLQETWAVLQSLKQPQITLKMNVLDLEQLSADAYKHEAVRIGDTVHVLILKKGTRVAIESRVMEMQRDLLDPQNTEVTIGNVPSDIGDLVRNIEKKVEKKGNVGGSIGWLQGVIDTANSELHSSNGYVYLTDCDGILITNRPKDGIDNPADQAIQLKAGGLAVSNHRRPDGSWDWKTFILRDQMMADGINSGRIRTDEVTIGDDAGMVRIAGGHVMIKGGGLAVYATPDAKDNGVLIKGNKLFTNFVKNPDFDVVPDARNDWVLAMQTRYHASKLVIDCTSTMPFTGVSQSIDIYHPRATFQALFQTHLIGGSTPKKVRFYLYNYDKNGNRLADVSIAESFATFQKWHLLNGRVYFPTGTTRCILFVQVQIQSQLTAGMEIHWVKGCYDEYVVQDQLPAYPKDVYNVQANPEIQAFQIDVDVSKSVNAGNYYDGGRIYFDKPFAADGRIFVVLNAIDGNSVYFSARAYKIDTTGFQLYIYCHKAISGPRTLYVQGLAYRAGYYGQLGVSL